MGTEFGTYDSPLTGLTVSRRGFKQYLSVFSTLRSLFDLFIKISVMLPVQPY